MSRWKFPFVRGFCKIQSAAHAFLWRSRLFAESRLYFPAYHLGREWRASFWLSRRLALDSCLSLVNIETQPLPSGGVAKTVPIAKSLEMCRSHLGWLLQNYPRKDPQDSILRLHVGWLVTDRPRIDFLRPLFGRRRQGSCTCSSLSLLLHRHVEVLLHRNFSL